MKILSLSNKQICTIPPADLSDTNIKNLPTEKTQQKKSPYDSKLHIFYTNAITKSNNISFGSNIFQEFDDQSLFNEENSQYFNINFLNTIDRALFNYKKDLNPELSLYLIDNQSAKNAESSNNVTLMNNASAQNIKGLFADLHDNTKADNVNATKNIYTFGYSSINSAKADRIFLNDNSHSSKNNARIVWLKDRAEGDNITADTVFQRNYAQSANVTAKNFFARDNVYCKNVNTNNIVLKDNARADEVSVNDGNTELYNNSCIQDLTVNNSKIFVNKNTKINHITSEDNLDITGNGTIGDIDVKGSHVFIRGPVNLTGKIRFLDKEGVVIVQKGSQNIFPKLNSSMVENGILQFLIQKNNEAFLGNPVDVYSDGINTLQEHIKDYKTQKMITLPENIKTGLIKNVSSEQKNLFYQFYTETLNTMASGNTDKKYSLFWVNNAKIGDKNLVDLWLEFLGKNTDKLSDTQKTYIINNLSDEEKQVIAEKTSEFWLKNILPDLEKEIDCNDLDKIKQDIKSIQYILEEINNSPDKFIEKLDNQAFFKKLCALELNNKKLIDLWTNTDKFSRGENALTKRLKKAHLKNTLKKPDLLEEIKKITGSEIDKQELSMKNFELACNDLLENEPELDKLEKKLLSKYKNSKTFYGLISEKTNGAKSVSETESAIISIIKMLSAERNTLAVTARKDIFDKTLKVPDVVISKPNTDLNNYVNFVFNTLSQNIYTMDDSGLMDFSDNVQAFENFVNRNSYYFGNYWKDFVKDAYQFYSTNLLDKITDNNLKLLCSIEAAGKNRKDKTIADLIERSGIDTIEKKEFIGRFQDDYNFLKLMKNTGINQKEVLTDLLMTEALNEHLYRKRLSTFCSNINNESVKENLDITDKYLRILDKDYPAMTVREKTDMLSKIPQEEFILLNKMIFEDWKNNELRKFMSDKFAQIQLDYNINAQSKNITETLQSINNNLNNIRINIAGQSYTLLEISANLDKMVNISQKSFKELYFIGENIEAIKHNSESIMANTRGILYAAMQNSKLRDPELSKMISDLLPETEQTSFNDFLTVVEKKYKILKDEKRKQQLKTIAQLATIAAAASGISVIAPDVITELFGKSETISKISSAVVSAANTLKHVAVFKAATTGFKQT